MQAAIDLSAGYGRGFQVTRRETYTAFGHGGAVAGYLASLEMNRKTGMAVIVLANSTGALSPVNLALQSLDILSTRAPQTP